MSEASLFTGVVFGDPEVRFQSDGAPVARFVLRRDPVFDEQIGRACDPEPRDVICTAWRGLAEHVAESLVDGVRVLVVGELVSTWLNHQSVPMVEASDVGISLTDRIAYTEAAAPPHHRTPPPPPDRPATAAMPSPAERAPVVVQSVAVQPGLRPDQFALASLQGMGATKAIRVI